MRASGPCSPGRWPSWPSRSRPRTCWSSCSTRLNEFVDAADRRPAGGRADDGGRPSGRASTPTMSRSPRRPTAGGPASCCGERRIDCMVLTAELPDMTVAGPGRARSASEPAAGRLPRDRLRRAAAASNDESALENASASSCTCGRVHSPERLLDQTTFFLHRDLAKLPERSGRCSWTCTSPTSCWPARRC